ncbi:MAG: phosphomannomutase/phosphoglucomutase [Eubacterium sp.]|nr:phosphomannomutase/phosphoglucomutase [Eubacterium sp.]
MDLNEYLKLQNGSDIRGVAVEGVEGENVNLSAEGVFFIAKAFAGYVAELKGKDVKDIKIAIGHDSRISAESLKKAAICGIKSTGAAVTDCHLASTPSMFMATVLPDLMYDGAIMMTASHLPYNRNGLKFFTSDGGFEKAQITDVLSLAYEQDAAAGTKTDLNMSADEEYDLISRYSAHLCDIIKKEVNSAEYDVPLKGLHIVVDAGNGAGGFFAEKVLKPLGADISGSRFLEPDGMFPNHIPNPENKVAMAAIQEATISAKADFGLIFDTDVDRAAAVFSDGTEVSRNAVIALMAAIVAKDHPNTTVVTDSVTSDELAEFLEKDLGLSHHRFKRGYKNVINEAIRLNAEGKETHLAMETSGHGALKENYFLDDGAYLSVKMVIELAKRHQSGEKMEDLISSLKYPKDSGEFRLKIALEDFASYGQGVIKDLMEFSSWQQEFNIVPDNYEGVRISYNDGNIHGWLLLRMSLHDPLLPLNIETKEDGGVKVIKEKLLPFFEQYDALDISPLK